MTVLDELHYLVFVLFSDRLMDVSRMLVASSGYRTGCARSGPSSLIARAGWTWGGRWGLALASGHRTPRLVRYRES